MGQAQNFTPVTNDSTFYGESTDSDFYGYINVNNDLGTSQSLYWEVDSVNLPSQWQFSVCDQDICHPIGTVEANWTLPFSQGYLNMHFYPNDQEGEGFVIIRVYDSPDAEQVEYLTFRGNAISQAGIGVEAQVIALDVYPNPFSDKINVSGDIDRASYAIMDVQGKTVQKGILHNDSALNLAELNEGIYFIKIIQNGTLVTRKVIKK